MPNGYSYWLGCFAHYVRFPSGALFAASSCSDQWFQCDRELFRQMCKTPPDMILNVLLSPSGCWDACYQVERLNKE